MSASFEVSPRVCILTPSAIGANPRVVKEADALQRAGCAVTVLSTRTHDFIDRRDDVVLENVPWRPVRLDFRIRRNGWRLRRATQIALARAFRLAHCCCLADLAFSPFSVPLLRAARQVAADLYIAHYPAALPAAAAAARRHGALYAYDAEDFHLGDWPEGSAYESQRRLLRAIEARYLPGCAYVTAAAPGIADAYQAAYGVARPSVVLNVFPLAEAPPRPSTAGTERRPSVYWFSQTLGPDRGLECAIGAIARARTRPHLYLRGNPAAGYADRLFTLAHAGGAADRLHLLPPADPRQMARLAAAYDVGLAGETGLTPNHRIALANKIFTYLLAGVPVVMSDIPAQRHLAAELGDAARLYAADDTDSLAGALDAVLGHAPTLAAARAAAYALGQNRFNWDREKDILLGLVAASLARIPAPAEPPRLCRLLRRRPALAERVDG